MIIATGNKKMETNIKGVQNFEGKGVSYCAICDGFFFKNKNVAVIGNGKYALSEAEHLKHIVKSITILTNGENLIENKDFEVNTKKIRAVHGENKLQSVEFEDGTSMALDGIFIAMGEAGGVDFAKKMGVILKGDSVRVDENMQTNIDGLYSCGNVVGGLLQICKASYEGAIAGLSAIKYAKNNNVER